MNIIKLSSITLIICFLLVITSACSEEPNEDQLYGYVEAKRIYIGAEASGRITTMTMKEGDSIAREQLVFSLDDSRELAQVQVLEAKRNVILTQLSDSKVQVQRPVDIAVLEAALERAKADLAFTEKELKRITKLVKDGVYPNSSLDAAEANQEKAAASVSEATKRITAAKKPVRASQSAIIAASLKDLDAQIDQAKIELEKRNIFAFSSGVVQEIFFRTGEVISAGQPVLSLVPEDNLIIRFFIPEPKRATLAIGKNLKISLDGWESDYTARISFIANEPEYTPPVLLTRETRDSLVYMVEAKINEANKLTPGQPVTIHLEAAGEEK